MTAWSAREGALSAGQMLMLGLVLAAHIVFLWWLKDQKTRVPDSTETIAEISLAEPVEEPPPPEPPPVIEQQQQIERAQPLLDDLSAATAEIPEDAPLPVPPEAMGARPVISAPEPMVIGGGQGAGSLPAALGSGVAAISIDAPLAVPAESGKGRYLKPVKRVAPRYSQYAREHDMEGTVTLRVKVDGKGVPQSTEVAQSSGYAVLDGYAMDAVLQWRFEPALADDGSPRPASGLVDVVFRLN